MQTRRDFIRSAAALTGSAFVVGSVPEAIARAMNINPAPGTTFLDAEHVVILMQENRSFDHCYGALQGVRGFRDPRAHRLPNGNPVWFQTDAKGDTYAPFRLDIKGTNVTWMGGLPHSWPDQVDARNGGRYDRWLHAKPKAGLPFTLGHYNREDLPFYYALADAFTVCDHAFCSSLTGTTPNRLYLWTGTIRENPKATARVSNGDTDYTDEAAWTTFPERLEDAKVSWRIYQNEISIDSGFRGEEDSWLSNFTDNPIEWFTQYRVRFSKTRRKYVQELLSSLPGQIETKEKELVPTLAADAKEKLTKEIERMKATLQSLTQEQKTYNDTTWNALSDREKALHEKAFFTNADDPDYRTLETLTYEHSGQKRKVQVPKGDTLHQFRKDVKGGKLPAVSWIVAPENFSDHPSSAWYGAWYVSEVMNILTEDPEVWKKTIFILCYDENDGYFDHLPPFVAPFPGRPETGKVSTGIDTTEDVSDAHKRTSPIGLGYRCPLVVASPWSRGGCVNSQVFDHTSVIQLLEVWLGGKGKKVRESNISNWRRTVCGDLTSTFRPYNGEKLALPKMLDRDTTVKSIHDAKFLSRPQSGKALSPAEIAQGNVGSQQEPGIRPSCALPYYLTVNGALTAAGFAVSMEARKGGSGAQGAPFNGYSYGPSSEMVCRSYAVRTGDRLEDTFAVDESYHVRMDGPNGFMREFRGKKSAPHVTVTVTDASGALGGTVFNALTNAAEVTITDESYGAPVQKLTVKAGGTAKFRVDLKPGQGWYDFTVRLGDQAYRYAGRVETGKWSVTDPAMGR